MFKGELYFMIDVYTWPTPNGHKVHIMLHETELAHTIYPINIQVGDQFKPEFLKISPNNKMPAIVDQSGPDGDPVSVFESAAILLYLAEKTGRYMPEDARAKIDVWQWLMFQMGTVGPMLDNHTISMPTRQSALNAKRFNTVLIAMSTKASACTG